MFLGAFSFPIGIASAQRAELVTAMKAMELSLDHGWISLWLETDSMFVLSAFQNSKVVPWDLHNRWNNCILNMRSSRFYVSHIFREGKFCADALAKYGLSINTFTWWDLIPSFLGTLVHFDRIGKVSYRFPT